MPAKDIVDNGSAVVNAAEVVMAYKSDVIPPPPAVGYYVLVVIPKGVGKPESPQLRFTTSAARDDYYDKLVTAMES